MKIGIVGCFQNGKSTLINCLLGVKLAPTGGDGVSVTQAITSYCYYSQNCILSIDGRNKNLKYSLTDVGKGKIRNAKEITIGCNSPILKYVTLVDTPGFNANFEDTQVAMSSLKNIDIAIMVVNSRGLSSIELDIVKEIQIRNMPYYIVMNCVWERGTHISTWNPQSGFNKVKCAEVLAKVQTSNFPPLLINKQPIIVVNAIWYWYAITKFQFELPDKKEYLLDCIERYKVIVPDTDFFNDSNVTTLLNFLSSPLNFLPLKIYKLLSKNVNKSICKIIDHFTIYPHHIRQISIKEIEKQQHEIEKSLQLITKAENELLQVRYSTTEFRERNDNSFVDIFYKWINYGGSLPQMLIERASQLNALYNRSSQIQSEKEKIEIELNSISAYIKLLSELLNNKNS